MLARDLTDAHGHYVPEEDKTPDGMTNDVVAHFEKYLVPTIHMVSEMRKATGATNLWIVDPVRFAPWGKKMRPHLFEEHETVTVSFPLRPKADIRYTLDSTEPVAGSRLYTGPLDIRDTTHIRAAAFEGGKCVSIPSEASLYPQAWHGSCPHSAGVLIDTQCNNIKIS